MWRTALRVPGVCLRRPNLICGSVRLPLLLPPAEQRQQLCVRREYRSQGTQLVKVIGVQNPLIWLRNKTLFFIIRAFLDPEFTEDEFSRGARQAFLFVSEKMSQNKFDALENVVDSKALEVLQNNCRNLSDNCKKALAVESNEIVYLAPADVELRFDMNGKKFVKVLMHFCYLKDADLLDDGIDITAVCKLAFGIEVKDNRCIITATYEFHREYSPGAKTDWIIAQIEHSQF